LPDKRYPTVLLYQKTSRLSIRQSDIFREIIRQYPAKSGKND